MMELELNEASRASLSSFTSSGRLIHTVIIESRSKKERENAALFLAAYAVCTSSESRPCLNCVGCEKTLSFNHPDVIVPEPSKTSKTGIISIKDLRDRYLSKAFNKPNDADSLVFLFKDAERLLREDSQNTLLKLIEEPPQNILFLFTVENAELLLETVRSRAQLITLKAEEKPDDAVKALSDGIVDGIVSLYEFDLLKATLRLGDRETAKAALRLVTEHLRDALAFLSGVKTDSENAKKLSRKLDRKTILSLMEVTANAIGKLNTNLNLTLIASWLCASYRRISWQK